MKKTISTIALCLCAIAAYAVTEAQKTAFSEITKNKLGSVDETKALAMSAASAVKPIADWALESPKEAAAWMRSAEKVGPRGFWLLIAYYETQNQTAFSEIQDFALWGGRFTYDRAMNDSEAYSGLKSANFEYDGVKMEDNRVLRLALKYGDLDLAESFPVELLAEYFDAYLRALEKSIVNASGKDAWEKLVRVRRAFTPYQDRPKVKDNWARLVSDEESAYVDYKRS